jgi:hypothetical protein
MEFQSSDPSRADLLFFVLKWRFFCDRDEAHLAPVSLMAGQ